MGAEPSARTEPTLAWKVVAALIVAAFAAGICWFVEWRSAPPPPPVASQAK
jgi:hypothetical protein